MIIMKTVVTCTAWLVIYFYFIALSHCMCSKDQLKCCLGQYVLVQVLIKRDTFFVFISQGYYYYVWCKGFLYLFPSLTAAWCMYLRYKQVRMYYCHVEGQGIEPNSDRSRSVRRKQLINKACLVIGIITSLGVSIVANFQVSDWTAACLMSSSLGFDS